MRILPDISYPCKTGNEMLKEHMRLINEVEENPFVADEEEILDVTPIGIVINDDEEDYKDIEIL